MACQTQSVEERYCEPTNVDLGNPPADPGRSRTVVVIAMPVLTLTKMHESEPPDVARGALGSNLRPQVAHAIYAALGVQGQNQTDGA